MALKPGDKAPPFAFTDAEGVSRTLAELLAGGGPVVLVFARYAGCPVCQLQTARLGRSGQALAARGALLVKPDRPGSATAPARARSDSYPPPSSSDRTASSPGPATDVTSPTPRRRRWSWRHSGPRREPPQPRRRRPQQPQAATPKHRRWLFNNAR